MAYEIHFAGRWRRVRPHGDAFMVALPEDSAVFIGAVIGPACMARKIREGTARVVRDDEPPTPPAIECANPAVAGILDLLSIRRTLAGAA